MNLSDYVHVLSIGTHKVLYNALTTKVFLITDDQYDGLLFRKKYDTCFSPDELRRLSECGFFCDENGINIQSIIEANGHDSPSIFALYLILTEECNMQCRYCSQSAYRIRPALKNMSVSIVEATLEKFYQTKTIRQRAIVLYGGEPTINKQGLCRAINYVRMEKSDWDTEIVMFTNGILLDDSLIDFLHKNKVSVIVSIDGPGQINDTCRIYQNDGSFHRVDLVLQKCMKKQIKIGLSATIASHNIAYLPRIVEFFCERYSPFSIGLNPLHYPPQGREMLSVDSVEMAAAMIDAYRIAANKGVYIEQIMRRVRPFVMAQPRLKDCPSCGGMIRVLPDGSYGPCGHFMEENQEQVDAMFEFEDNLIMKKWNSRLSVRLPSCMSCKSMALCGGGCPYNSSKNHGSIFSANDGRSCEQAKMFLEWLLQEVTQDKEPNVFAEITIRDKLLLLKNISLDKYIPLENYSKYGEFIIGEKYR